MTGASRFVPVLGLLMALMVWVFPLEALANDEHAQICAQAAERYKELYGDAGDEKDVVIVKMYKYTFCPSKISVHPGTKVRWINVDKRTSHSVWIKEAGVEESERIFPEEIWEYEFKEAGEFPYLCGPHGDSEGMRGSVSVVE